MASTRCRRSRRRPTATRRRVTRGGNGNGNENTKHAALRALRMKWYEEHLAREALRKASETPDDVARYAHRVADAAALRATEAAQRVAVTRAGRPPERRVDEMTPEDLAAMKLRAQRMKWDEEHLARKALRKASDTPDDVEEMTPEELAARKLRAQRMKWQEEGKVREALRKASETPDDVARRAQRVADAAALRATEAAQRLAVSRAGAPPPRWVEEQEEESRMTPAELAAVRDQRARMWAVRRGG
jgi:hypothetical protein